MWCDVTKKRQKRIEWLKSRGACKWSSTPSCGSVKSWISVLSIASANQWLHTAKKPFFNSPTPVTPFFPNQVTQLLLHSSCEHLRIQQTHFHHPRFRSALIRRKLSCRVARVTTIILIYRISPFLWLFFIRFYWKLLLNVYHAPPCNELTLSLLVLYILAASVNDIGVVSVGIQQDELQHQLASIAINVK